MEATNHCLTILKIDSDHHPTNVKPYNIRAVAKTSPHREEFEVCLQKHDGLKLPAITH